MGQKRPRLADRSCPLFVVGEDRLLQRGKVEVAVGAECGDAVGSRKRRSLAVALDASIVVVVGLIDGELSTAVHHSVFPGHDLFAERSRDQA